MAYDPTAWATFSGAIVTADAALVGLIFVAVSINLDHILALPGMDALAFEALLVPSVVLISAVAVLVPGQPVAALAVELVLVVIAHVAVSASSRRAAKASAPEGRHDDVLTQVIQSIPGVLILIAAGSLALGAGGGLYWLAPAWVVGMLLGIFNAWRLLVEVKRV